MSAEHGAQPISKEILGARRQGTSEVSNKAMFVTDDEHRAQPFITELDGARTHRGILDPNTATLVKDRERCAMPDISAVDMARTRKSKSNLETIVIEAEIHAENNAAEHLVQFEDKNDFSDAGSLITQAPQPHSIHATINALSSRVSAIQPRESWYLAGWIGDSPIDFLVDPGAVVSAISLPCYEKLMEANAILTPMRAIRMELEAANKSDMRVHGMCNLELSVHGLLINMDTLVVDLNCHAIMGMDVLGDASKLPFILDLVGGTLSGGGYETIQLHRFEAATECFAETTDSVCIPPHSEVMLWAKLKTNNGRKGPTAGVVLALQTFVQEFGLLVGRSLVRADADDWKIPILIYNSDPCTRQTDICTCNPVIVPARTRIARVEEIQAIQHIGSRETESHSEEGALPPHLIDVLDAATELTANQRARAAHLLTKHIKTFPASGTPITGRTEAVMHDIDTGSTRPIRCNPRKLSPKKIKIQQELVDKMLEEGQIEHSVSAWSAPTVLVTKKDGTTRFCVDYRRLNDNTKKDAFPLPRIDDSLNSLSGQAWFSTLDLASGYWQVRLSEDAKPKTAFATHSGIFQFAVMPFGLCNAPATFERLMSQVMRGLHWKRCLVYIDDILVFGHDFESALQSLELVLIRVAEYGLQLKSTKCNLFRCSAHHNTSSGSDQVAMRAPNSVDLNVMHDIDTSSMAISYPAPSSTWNLQDENCILSLKSHCSLDVKGYRFFTMERLFYALQLLSLGDKKFIGQLAKYSRMDYVRKCVNTRFEMASNTLQEKWLDDQFQTWLQIITARILSDPAFKLALVDSAGSPLFDPEEPVYATALTSARKMCLERNVLKWPSWIALPTRETRGQALA